MRRPYGRASIKCWDSSAQRERAGSAIVADHPSVPIIAGVQFRRLGLDQMKRKPFDGPSLGDLLRADLDRKTQVQP
jgi:hypothetical protein